MTSDTESSDNDLHIAVRYGAVKEVKQALECRLSPNKIGLYQWTPLHEAASNGHSDILQLLLKHGGNPNIADRLCANTALHYAAVEGHPTCLRLLIEAGGDYSITNNEGETAFDLATRACERVIEKKRVEQLIRMPLKEAKHDAKVDIHRIESAADDAPTSHPTISTDVDFEPIDTSIVQQRVKAWSPQITKHDPATLGTLHMSFEYNSKKSYLKIRLWKLTGLLVSETHSTMISTLYVKSALLPDLKKTTKRKSEEVKLSTLLGKQKVVRKPTQPYLTETGSEVLFEPITFKFSKPLIYEPITSDDVMHKVVYIQVSLKQKYTHRTYKIADLSIPLQVAVTRIVKESFPLRICTETKLPETMMVLGDTKSQMTTASDPNLRQIVGTPLSLPKSDARPASDVNLREVLSVSSQSPSLSIDISSDDDSQAHIQPLSQVIVQPEASTDVVVPMPGAIEVEAEDESRLHAVVIESNTTGALTHTTGTSTHTPHTVRVVVTNDDSDSSSDDQSSRTPRNKLTSLFRKHSTNQVIELESGQGHALQPSAAARSTHDSFTAVREGNPYSLTRHRLKPKLLHSTNLPTSSSSFSKALAGAGDDVVLSIGDLELDDLDEPAKVHTQCKRTTAEQLV